MRIPSPAPVPLRRGAGAGHTAGLVGTFRVRGDADADDGYDAVVDWLAQTTSASQGVQLDRAILSPEEWIESPYHAGPYARDFLWPEKKLAFIGAAHGTINEVLLTGAIGWGKSELLRVICAYDVYRASCFTSPQGFLGFLPTSRLAYVLIHQNERKAQDKLLDPLLQVFDSTPYFLRECPRDKALTSRAYFPKKNLVVRTGVTGENAIHGDDVLGCYLTECIAAGSQILLADGHEVPVEDFGVGPRLIRALSPRGVWTEALAVRKAVGIRDCVRVEFDSGRSLICTSNHPILTTAGYVLAGELHEGAYGVRFGGVVRGAPDEVGAGTCRVDLEVDRGGSAAGVRWSRGVSAPSGDEPNRGRQGTPGSDEAGGLFSRSQGQVVGGADWSEAFSRDDREDEGGAEGPVRSHNTETREGATLTRGSGGAVSSSGGEDEGSLGRSSVARAPHGESAQERKTPQPGVLRPPVPAESRAGREDPLVRGGQGELLGIHASTWEEALSRDQGEDERGQAQAPADCGLRVPGQGQPSLRGDPVPEYLGDGLPLVRLDGSTHRAPAVRVDLHPVHVRRGAEVVRPGLRDLDGRGDLPDRGEAAHVREEGSADQGEVQGCTPLLSGEELDVHLHLGAGVEVDRVVRVSPAGRHEVYDLCVPAARNFVANGFVTHNCNFYPVILDSARKRGGEILDVASDIIESLYRRWESRFLRDGRLQLCRLVLDSSRQYPDDALELREKKVLRGEAKYPTRVYSFSQWEAKRGVLDNDGKPHYSGATFPVEVASGSRASRILELDEVAHAVGRVVWCAAEHRSSFEENVDGSLRDLAGVAVEGLRPLFPQREALTSCIRGDDFEPVEVTRHPFTATTTTLRDAVEFLPALLADPDTGLPRVGPRRLRVIHCDPALSGDAFGLVMGHVSDVVTINRLTDGRLDVRCTACGRSEVAGRITCPRCAGAGHMTHFGRRTTCQVCQKAKTIRCPACKGTGLHGTPLDRPRIHVDLALQIQPPKTGRIQFDDVAALIDRIRSVGFQVAVVTADGHQSEYFLQRQSQIPGVWVAEKLSVDLRKDPYYALRDAVMDVATDGGRRLSMYHYPPLFDELCHLEDRRMKIDHPKTGGKDVADALAGVVYNCERFDFLQESVTPGALTVTRFGPDRRAGATSSA